MTEKNIPPSLISGIENSLQETSKKNTIDIEIEKSFRAISDQIKSSLDELSERLKKDSDMV